MRSASRLSPWRLVAIALIWIAALTFASRRGWQLWRDSLEAAPAPVETSALGVWFTDPASAQARSYRGGPAAELTAALEQARLSIDVAVYSLDLWPVRNALLDAHRRGLRVRLVVEADNADTPEIQALRDAGIPVHVDTGDGLMHHKFLILDGRDVWTGSMNLTAESAYRDHNNLLRLQTSEAVADFQQEFDEMFSRGLFGAASPADTPFPAFAAADGRAEVYFSPDDGVLAHLLETVNAAQQEICFLAFSFTSDDLGGLLLSKAQEGLTVRGVFDEGQAHSNRGSEYPRLRSAGLDVRLDGSSGLLHHKVIVLDGQTVVTGSYNFSRSAEERNDEALLILHLPEIAAAYQEECVRLWEDGR